VCPVQPNSLFARQLFDGVAEDYHRPARAFSFWQYGKWHRFLLSRLGDPTHKRVLDMSTGTGLIASGLASRWDAQVVGVDLSPNMLAHGLARIKGEHLKGSVSLVLGQAEAPPFGDESFDAVIFSYLLRYVDDVPSTLSGLARLVKPGGLMVSLEFGVPSAPWLKLPWLAYTHWLMPLAMYPISPGWRRVGGFLGPSIHRFYAQYPLSRQVDLWNAAGLRGVETRSLSLGGAVVMWGTKC